MAIGQFLPRLGAVITKTEDHVLYYVPKEIRKEAEELKRRLKDSQAQAATSLPTP
jgi:hypothetical protein